MTLLLRVETVVWIDGSALALKTNRVSRRTRDFAFSSCLRSCCFRTVVGLDTPADFKKRLVM